MAIRPTLLLSLPLLAALLTSPLALARADELLLSGDG